MSNLSELAERLREHQLSHTELIALQEDIHRLVRLVTQGLLFESDKENFFSVQVSPVVELLINSLRRTYGRGHPGVARFSVEGILKEIRDLEELFCSDIDAALMNDPATDDALEVIICYPGFKAIRYQRIAHLLYKHRVPLLPRLLSELAHQQTGVDIHPGAKIGAHFFIDHGTGVVIGETAEIGEGVTLYQGVTLGAKRFRRHGNGSVVKGEPRHPILGNRVTIYAGATILGRITIGEGSMIGGNVWITEDVPPGSRIMQQHYVTSYFDGGDGI
jgi:serine O-acetyltransferase